MQREYNKTWNSLTQKIIRPRVIAITGSIASGKTTTAKMFEKYGFQRFDSDKAVHNIYEYEGEKWLKSSFPEAIEGQRADRKKLSDIIKKDPQALQKLEEIIHPLIFQKEHEWIAEKAKDQGTKYGIIIDSPLFLEAKRHKIADVIIVVTVSKTLQKQRALSRKNMTEDKFKQILKRQMPVEEKKKQAHFIISTDNGLENTQNQVHSLVKSLQQMT